MRFNLQRFRKLFWTKRPSASKLWFPKNSFRLAIGRRGQNVRLASQLTALDIDIMTEEEESASAG